MKHRNWRITWTDGATARVCYAFNVCIEQAVDAFAREHPLARIDGITHFTGDVIATNK